MAWVAGTLFFCLRFRRIGRQRELLCAPLGAGLPELGIEDGRWGIIDQIGRRLVSGTSTFIAGGRRLPEFDHFAILPWDEAMARVGASLARLLSEAGAVATLRTRLDQGPDQEQPP